MLAGFSERASMPRCLYRLPCRHPGRSGAESRGPSSAVSALRKDRRLGPGSRPGRQQGSRGDSRGVRGDNRGSGAAPGNSGRRRGVRGGGPGLSSPWLNLPEERECETETRPPGGSCLSLQRRPVLAGFSERASMPRCLYRLPFVTPAGAERRAGVHPPPFRPCGRIGGWARPRLKAGATVGGPRRQQGVRGGAGEVGAAPGSSERRAGPLKPLAQSARGTRMSN